MKTLEKIYTSFMSDARVGNLMARNAIVGCVQFIHPKHHQNNMVYSVMWGGTSKEMFYG